MSSDGKDVDVDKAPGHGDDGLPSGNHDQEPDFDLPFVCPECNKGFQSFRQLQGHSLGAHQLALRRGDLGGVEGPPQRATRPSNSENPLSDLVDDIPLVKSAVNISRWKNRLRAQDPAMFKLLFPAEATTETASSGVSSKLVDLEMANYVRSLTEKNESSRQPQIVEGPYEEITEYVDKNGNIAPPDKAFTMRTTKRPVASAPRESADVRELKEKVDSLTKSLQDEKLASLKTSLDTGLASLRSEITNQQSELKTLITETSSIVKSWISAPGPVATATMSRLGFDAIPIPPSEAPEGARDDIIEGLRKHGFTARIIEKGKSQ